MEAKGDNPKKRRAEDDGSNGGNNANQLPEKKKKQWQTPHGRMAAQSRKRDATIEPGDVGIFATCDRGKEGKAARELLDLFEEKSRLPIVKHARFMYPQKLALNESSNEDTANPQSEDIEDEVQRELESMQKGTGTEPSTRRQQLFTHVRLNLQCVLFFRTTDPVEPAAFVHMLCKRIREHPERRTSRFAKRLTPVVATGKARANSITEIAEPILATHFHSPSTPAKKYAIRTTFRNHNGLKREDVIQQIASMVGPKHPVDLTNPDVVILMELYQDICGVTVVDGDYESLKRYNLAEIGSART